MSAGERVISYHRGVATNPPHIGTLREKPLHSSLKDWCFRTGDGVEVPIDGYVIDLVRDDLLIEVQTRGFASMKQKLISLIDSGHNVRIVHPIALDRWIVKVESDGTIVSRRKSPKHGDPTDVFSELVSFPELLSKDNLEIELVLTAEEEYRRHEEGKAWRRKGWVVMERRLLEVLESRLITSTDDLIQMLPATLPDPFTTADLAEGLERPRRNAQQMAYCLRKAGLIEEVARSGRLVHYQVS